MSSNKLRIKQVQSLLVDHSYLCLLQVLQEDAWSLVQVKACPILCQMQKSHPRIHFRGLKQEWHRNWYGWYQCWWTPLMSGWYWLHLYIIAINCQYIYMIAVDYGYGNNCMYLKDSNYQKHTRPCIFHDHVVICSPSFLISKKHTLHSNHLPRIIMKQKNWSWLCLQVIPVIIMYLGILMTTVLCVQPLMSIKFIFQSSHSFEVVRTVQTLIHTSQRTVHALLQHFKDFAPHLHLNIPCDTSILEIRIIGGCMQFTATISQLRLFTNALWVWCISLKIYHCTLQGDWLQLPS